MGQNEYFLGVDGGGTKSIGLLVDREGAEIVRRVAPASNPNVVGLEAASSTLVELVEGMCHDAGPGAEKVSGAVFGIAGMGSEENILYLRKRLLDKFGPSFPVHIETDARIALEGALSGEPGIMVIAGTGSAVMGKDPSGSDFLVGGWGRTLGDEGSGYFLGVEVVKVFTRILDGYLVSDKLSRAFSERLGWTSRAHLITAVYKEKLELSTLAPFVMDLAAQDIPAAREILTRGARALTEQVLLARARLPMASVRIATLGGLIDTPTIYREALRASLHQADPGLTVCFPDRTAVEGAIAMARATVVS